jgi:TonB family protein
MPMFHDESQLENHLERSAPLPLPAASQNEEGQRKRMLIALAILLVALAAVVLKDWDFWFPPSAEVQEATVRRKSARLAAAAAAAPAIAGREHKGAKPAVPTIAAGPYSATTERAVLPPLQVEIVAGNRHINAPGKSNAIHLDVDPSTASATSGTSGSTAGSNTAGSNSAGSGASATPSDRMQLSPQTSQTVSVSVPPDYPLLARQMKVQGAVSLQALISRDGSIQELQILSGPAILAAAAREAVKQWHFKPYLQNGQPVETQARITVNFTISTN